MMLVLPYMENGKSHLDKKIWSNVFYSSHEVNIANVPSGYTLKPHYQKALDDESKNTVKVNSIPYCSIMSLLLYTSVGW